MNSSKNTLQARIESGRKAVLVVATLVASLLALDNLRILGDPILGSIILIETHYYYALIGLLLPFAFLLNPMTTRPYRLFVDVILALIAIGSTCWLFLHSEDMLDEGWEFEAPQMAVYIS